MNLNVSPLTGNDDLDIFDIQIEPKQNKKKNREQQVALKSLQELPLLHSSGRQLRDTGAQGTVTLLTQKQPFAVLPPALSTPHETADPFTPLRFPGRELFAIPSLDESTQKIVTHAASFIAISKTPNKNIEPSTENPPVFISMDGTVCSYSELLLATAANNGDPTGLIELALHKAGMINMSCADQYLTHRCSRVIPESDSMFCEKRPETPLYIKVVEELVKGHKSRRLKKSN